MTDQVTPVNEANTVAANQPASAVVNPASETETQPSLFDSMVGAGKKFKDANALAFGKLNADQHIDSLTQELKELRERNSMLEAEYNNRKDLESLIAELKQTRETPPVVPGVETQGTIDVDSIVDKVKSVFDAENKAEVARRNANEAEEAIKAKYGQGYQEAVRKKVEELGMSMEAFVSTMATSPKAALTLLGVGSSSSNVPGAAPSTINTGANLGTGLTPRQMRIAEIQAVRKSNFQKYLGMQGELNRLLVEERLGK